MEELYHLPKGNETAKAFALRVLGLYVLALLVVSWVLTQRAAHRLDYAENLGDPWVPRGSGSFAWYALALTILALATIPFRLWRRAATLLLPAAAVLFSLSRGPLYLPVHFFAWSARFRHPLLVSEIWSPGLRHLAFGALAGVVVAGLVIVARWPRLIRPADIHGSARWANRADVVASGLSQPFDGEGLFLGHDPYRPGRYLRDAGPSHVFVFAPTRSGKGVGIVVPNLLTWPHSVLVHDMKGENWALTAGWRSRELRSLCLKLDPTCTDGSGSRYNPLLEIRLGDQEVRDAQNVADILVDPNGDKLRDHWDRTAHALLVGVILHVLYAERDRTLAGCASFLAHPARAIETALDLMLATAHAPPGHPGWPDPVTGDISLTHPTVAAAARALLDKSPNERSGVLSTALSFLDLYRDPILARNTAVSDFRIHDLVGLDRPLSLYLTVPPSDLSRTRPLVRLLLNQVCRRLTEQMDFTGGRGRGIGQRPLLLLLDEFPALGKLQFFQESLAYLAGYGIRAMLITQDLSQHQGVYGIQESITANCDVRIAFAANKPETARLLSDMCGRMTVHHFHRSLKGGRFDIVMDSRYLTTQEAARPLSTADEALRLPATDELVLVSGRPPIRAPKIRYYADPRFAKRAGIPPPSG